MADVTIAPQVQSALRGHPGTLALREIFAMMPDYAGPIGEHFGALMRDSSPLSAGEREMIYAYASKQNNCHFSLTSHSKAAIELGIAPGVFDVPPERVQEMVARPDVGRALHMAVAANRPGIPRDALARAQEMTRDVAPALVRDAVLCADMAVLLNRLIDGLGAWGTDDAHRANGVRIAKEGYLPAATLFRSRADRPAATAAFGGAFSRFGSRAGLIACLTQMQSDLLDGGPMPGAQTRAVRAAVASANGISRAGSPADAFVDYAVAVTLDPRWRGPDDSAALYAAGGTDAHLLQLVQLAAVANFLDRVAVALPHLCGAGAMRR